MLSKEEIEQHTKNYKIQASRILKFDGENPAKIRSNSEWHDKLTAIDFVQIAANFTFQQLKERDLFEKRLKSGEDVYLNELLYPIMQAYDSVAMEVDVELGGTDQTFNMLLGRKLVRALLGKEKFVMTVPLLTDAQGNKIGKTEGNVIGIADKPNELYAKIMALGDESIVPCLTLLTDMSMAEINKIKDSISKGENPLAFKKKLAFELTKLFNSEEEARGAQEFFEKTFQERKPEYGLKIPLGDTFAATISPFVLSRSASSAKRLIKQGGVDVNKRTITDVTYKLKSGDQLRIGSQTFGTVTQEK